MAPDNKDDDAYVIPDDVNVDETLGAWEAAAVYTLELPARCPHCREPIRTLKVLRLTRTHVTFTSSLPRGGRVLVCPVCERIVSAELGIL